MFYGVPEGLVQSQVLCIFQDGKGFLWIGTNGGVSRFDGMDFRNFTEYDGSGKPGQCNKPYLYIAAPTDYR
jgi:ligand-binding sensor domain-containing protein